jgi:hypothetical protein
MAKKPDRNGLYDPMDHPSGPFKLTPKNAPQSAVEAIQQGLNVFYDSKAKKFKKLRFKTNPRSQFGKSIDGYRFELEDWSNVKAYRASDSKSRRAQTAKKTLYSNDRVDYYKRNLVGAPGMTQFPEQYAHLTSYEELAKQMEADNNAALRMKAAEGRRTGNPYEHAAPQASPEIYRGGLETKYNIHTHLDPDRNAIKSDLEPSREVLSQHNIPQSRPAVYQAELANQPHEISKEAADDIYRDVTENPRPRARDRKRKLPALAKKRQAAQAAGVARDAAKFGGPYNRFGQLMRTAAKILV